MRLGKSGGGRGQTTQSTAEEAVEGGVTGWRAAVNGDSGTFLSAVAPPVTRFRQHAETLGRRWRSGRLRARADSTRQARSLAESSRDFCPEKVMVLYRGQMMGSRAVGDLGRACEGKERMRSVSRGGDGFSVVTAEMQWAAANTQLPRPDGQGAHCGRITSLGRRRVSREGRAGYHGTTRACTHCEGQAG